MTDIKTTPEHLSHHEFETDPFTGVELSVIGQYEQRTEGIPDCFDANNRESLRQYATEYGQPALLDFLRQMFSTINDWDEAISGISYELMLAGAGRSTAMTRYIGSQVVQYENAREQLRVGAVGYLLGEDKYGYGYDRARQCDGYRFVDDHFWINA